MSVYDLVMLVVFAGAILFGLWKGLAWQVASVAAIFLSYFVSMTFRGQVARFISAEEPWNQFAAMLILFLGTSLVVWTVFAAVSHRIKAMKLSGFDRQAGALLGALKGALLCMVVTMFAVSLLGNTARNAVYNSRSGGYIVRGINELSSVVPAEIHKYIDPYIARFNQQIVDVNGNLPTTRPIFGTSGAIQPTGPSSPWPNVATGNPGVVPATNNSAQPTSYQYNSGRYTQNPNAVPSYQGQWQTPAPAQEQFRNTGYNAPANYPPRQTQTYQQPNGYQAQRAPQPGQAPTANNSQPAASTANGWPDLNLRINSKDLLDRAIDGTRRVIENNTQ